MRLDELRHLARATAGRSFTTSRGRTFVVTDVDSRYVHLARRSRLGPDGGFVISLLYLKTLLETLDSEPVPTARGHLRPSPDLVAAFIVAMGGYRENGGYLLKVANTDAASDQG